jgi:ABC-type phosphate/phosphonate transport system substrate-binding protein
MDEMTAADTEVLDETELVEAWRAEQLELAGYGAAAAAELAARQDVDLHSAVEMLSRGCSPELALKILL